MSTKHTPGPWIVVRNDGQFGWPSGYYVYRQISTPSGVGNEWLTQRGGIRPFRTEQDARAAIAKAKGEQA